jgi:membrane-anchored protein YejM (alkaline phosphatase superfamily)
VKENDSLDPSVPAARSRYVSVVGWVAVVAGALLTFQSIYDTSTLPVATVDAWTSYPLPSEQTRAGVVGWVNAHARVVALLRLLLAGWLLAAGIGVVRRQPWARVGLIAWLVAAIAATTAYAAYSFEYMQQFPLGTVVNAATTALIVWLPGTAVCAKLLHDFASPRVRREFGNT